MVAEEQLAPVETSRARTDRTALKPCRVSPSVRKLFFSQVLDDIVTTNHTHLEAFFSGREILTRP